MGSVAMAINKAMKSDSPYVTHLRVVAAMLAREMATRFGNKPGGYLWALLDPVANITIMTLVFSALAHMPALGTSFPLFYATGFLAFQFYNAVETYVASATNANKTLFSYPNVAPFDAVVARYLLQMGTTTMVACIVLGFVIYTTRVPPNLHWPPIIEAAFAASMLAFGAALANNVLFSKYPIYEKIFVLVTRPLYLISGVFFLPDSIPHPFHEILLLNPLVHVLMLFRTGFYPEYRAESMDMGYLYGWVLVVFFLGMVIFRANAATLRGR